MKKLFIKISALFVLGLTVGCSEIATDAPALPEQNANAPGLARSVEEAEDIALGALYAFRPGARGEDSRAPLALTHTVITLPRSRNAAPDTILHVVDYGENEGFAVIGGPKNSEPLYAFVETGSFNDPEVLNVEGFQYFMECAAASIIINPPMDRDSLVTDTTNTQPLKTKTEYAWNLVKTGGRVINLAWGQGVASRGGEYEGLYCPNKTAGCVMTASLLVMAYHQQPTSMSFTFPERDCESAIFDWQSMKTHFAYHGRKFNKYDENGVEITITDNCSASEQQHRNLGRICRQIGYEINANYISDGGTWASTATAAQLLADQYVTSSQLQLLSWTNFSESEFIDLIDQGIAMTSGTDTNGSGGHAWITDAYKTMDCYENKYCIKPSISSSNEEWELIESKKLKTENFIHYNWGWNGYCNGYFNTGVFAVNEPHSFDPGMSGVAANRDYSLGVYYYFFIPK